VTPLGRVLLLAAGCGLAAVACSSGSSTPSATAPTPTQNLLTRATFVQQADTICKNASDAQKQLFSTVSDNPTPQQVSALLHQTETQYTTYRAQLDPLITSQPDAADLRSKWIQYDAADIAALQRMLKPLDDALRSHDTTAAGRAATAVENDATNNGAKAVAYLRSLGLTDCAALEAG
jgi:hypothetical protein